MLPPNPTTCAHPKRPSFQAIQAKKTTTARTIMMIVSRTLLIVMVAFPKLRGPFVGASTYCNASDPAP